MRIHTLRLSSVVLGGIALNLLITIPVLAQDNGNNNQKKQQKQIAAILLDNFKKSNFTWPKDVFIQGNVTVQGDAVVNGATTLQEVHTQNLHVQGQLELDHPIPASYISGLPEGGGTSLTAGEGIAISDDNVISSTLGVMVSANELEDNAVSSAKIQNGSVTAEDLASDLQFSDDQIPDNLTLDGSTINNATLNNATINTATIDNATIGSTTSESGIFTDIMAHSSMITPTIRIDGPLFNSGTSISGHMSVVADVTTNTITGMSDANDNCATYATVTVDGAQPGDTVTATPTPTPGEGFADGIENSTLTWNAYVSASDTVAIRACNASASAVDTVDGQTWRVDVWKH